MKKTILFTLLLIITAGVTTTAFAQHRQKVIFLQKYNNEPYHFGFLLGLNYMDYSLLLKENYQNEFHNKTEYPPGQEGISEAELNQFQIINVESHKTPGFSVGVIGDMRLGEFFNLRFIPTLSLSSKFVTYSTLLYDANGEVFADRDIESKDQLATFLEFPIHVKYRSKRYNNIGAYLIAGVNPKLYLASIKTKIDSGGHPALLQTNRGDVALELGTGFDIYNQWFKMGIELKLSYGLINVLKTDDLSMNFLYNSPLNEVRNKQLQLSFTFE